MDLPNVHGFRPYYNFIRAIKPISSSFVEALEVDLIRKERKDEIAPSIINLIKEFKEYYRMQQAVSATSTNSSAFVTLQGNSNTNSDANSKGNSNTNLDSNPDTKSDTQ